jgi:hypothetical protein
MIIRTDGPVAPSFPLHDASQDRLRIENNRFEPDQVREMKRDCQLRNAHVPGFEVRGNMSLGRRSRSVLLQRLCVKARP